MIEYALILFLRPYMALLIGAAYNIQQTLDAIGIVPSNFLEYDSTGSLIGSYWSPQQAMLSTLVLLMGYFLVLSAGALIAGFALGRTKGAVIAAAIWLGPGLLALAGAWPESLSFVPSRFAIGSPGELGSPFGMSALIALALLSGWIGLVISSDVLSLQDRFRHSYDHLWYSMAVLAGVFFVADNGAKHAHTDLDRKVAEMHRASEYLLGQARELAVHCQSLGLSRLKRCQWSEQVQQHLIEFKSFDAALYEAFGPKQAGDLYMPGEDPSPATISSIRSELAHYNVTLCPQDGNRITLPSHVCQRTPASYCRSMDSSAQQLAYLVGTVAVANECVIPTLVRLHGEIVRASTELSAELEARHARWLFYVLFAMIAGGKVANATARLSLLSGNAGGLGTEQNVRKLVRSVPLLVRRTLRILATGFNCLCHSIRRLSLAFRKCLEGASKRFRSKQEENDELQPLGPDLDVQTSLKLGFGRPPPNDVAPREQCRNAWQVRRD